MIPNEQQIEFILEDLRQRGIRDEELVGVLLDHVCSIFEREWPEVEDFEKRYAAIIPTFYKHDLREIEHQMFMMSRFRHHLALSRPRFLSVLFILIISPIIIYNLVSDSWDASGLYIPFDVWGSSIAYISFPLLSFMVIWLTPDRFEPLIPRDAVVCIGIRPFIAVLPAGGIKTEGWQQV